MRTAIKISEKAFQQQIIEAATYLGYMHYHTWDSRRSVAGYPDLTLVKSGRMIFVEVKVGRNKTSKAQDAWLDMLATCPGVEVYVWYPHQWNEIEATLKRKN